MVLDGKAPPSDEVVSQLQEISITLQTTQNTRLMGDEDVQISYRDGICSYVVLTFVCFETNPTPVIRGLSTY